MLSPQAQKIRTYIFNIINNNFEPFLRSYILNHLLVNHQDTDEWKNYVPEYTLEQASNKLKRTNYSLHDYIKTLYLSDLKNIMIYGKNFEQCLPLVGQNLTQEKFGELMDALNDTRSKVTHPYEITEDAL